MTSELRLATFNTGNLARAGSSIYDEPPLTEAESAVKTAFIRDRLAALDADLVGFQEVFHLDALARCTDGLYEAHYVLCPGEENRSATGGLRPRCALATRLEPLSAPRAVFDFSNTLELSDVELSVSARRFRRPVLHAVVALPDGRPLEVFVVHLKSPRPMLVDGADPEDPVAVAAGQARSLIYRAAEAAALRAMVVEARHRHRPVVVLGDFNDVARAFTTRLVCGPKAGAEMPAELRARTARCRLRHAADLAPGPQLGFSFLYSGRPQTLDHVLLSDGFSPHGQPTRVGSVRCLTDHLGALDDNRAIRTASDHAPVLATIHIPEDQS